MMKLQDIVLSVDHLMGVKAVFGKLSASVICFGTNQYELHQTKGYFSKARQAAEKAETQPFLITIGAGKNVPAELSGRVLELVKCAKIYGRTNAFVNDEAAKKRLMQWPVSVVVLETYRIVGDPRLIEDLGFTDRNILANAYDRVTRSYPELVEQLYNALAERTVERRWDVSPPVGFKDTNQAILCMNEFPTVSGSSREGREIWKVMRTRERDRTLRAAAIQVNRTLNGGHLTCESCGFVAEKEILLDAHHLEPVCAGERETRVADLAMLCPSCHRWCHAFAADRLFPVHPSKIKTMTVLT